MFIKLTDAQQVYNTNQEIYVNSGNIIMMIDNNGTTRLKMRDSEDILVLENTDEIIRKLNN